MPEWKRLLRARLADSQLEPAREAEIVEELAQHLEAAYEEALAGGATALEAEARARAQITDWQLLECELGRARRPADVATGVNRSEPATPAHGGRRRGGWRGMESLGQDVRYGLRLMLKRPGFTVVAVLTLALGVGANTAIFGAVNALLLRPLPIEDVDRVVFGMALREGFDPFGSSVLDYALYRDEARSFTSIGLGTQRQFNLLGRGDPERLRGAAVTASYLTTLGVRPERGRLFAADEDRAGGPAVALVSHELWQRRFGGDGEVIGRSLELEGRPHSIVGVLPPGFDLPYSAEVWVPMQLALDALPFEERAATAHELVARLRPGVRLQDADAELKTLARRLEQEHPRVRRGWSYGVIPLRQQLLGDLEGRTTRSLTVLCVAVAFLLLICCANVASLLLARGVAREGEIAIRRSLGAPRGRLVRQLLTETLLLAVLGGAAGVLLAYWARPILAALDPIQPTGLGSYLTDFHIDARVLAFSLAVTVLAAALSGSFPALKVTRADALATILKRRDQRASAGVAGARPLSALVVAEVAVAAALLVGGGLLVQSFHKLQDVDLGFRPDGLVVFELPVSPSKYPTVAHRARFIDRVLARVGALPQVAAAGITSNVPMQRGTTADSVYEAEGAPPGDASEVPITAHRMVSPGYPATLGVALVAGRLLDDGDGERTAPVVVVSEELARKAWPGQDALGKRVRRIRAGARGPWMTVVGVVRDVKEDRFNFRARRPVWYVPYAQQTFAPPPELPLELVVRPTGDPAGLGAAVRAAVRDVDPDQPVSAASPLREQLDDVLIAERFSAFLVGALAVAGLLLAAIGLYGVMAYTTGRRTGEIGLRVALGAQPRDVVRLVVAEGAALAAAGLFIGIASAFALARLLASILYEVSPWDPATFLAVAVALASAALLACWLPARRATRIDPMEALRSE
jgi:putative ABC transport system permease protein